MFAKSVILTLALAASAAVGFRVPDNAGDGIYVAGYDESGAESHSPFDLSQLDSRDAAAAAAVLPREAHGTLKARQDGLPSGSSPNCGGGSIEILPTLDWTTADSKFQTACSNTGASQLYNQRAIYAVSGDAVVYMCNYSKKGNPCRVSEYISAKSWLQGQCTLAGTSGVEAGWVSIPKWNKSYGWQNINDDFC